FEDSNMYASQVVVSAVTGEGIDDLLHAIERVFARNLTRMTVHIPFERGDLVARLYDIGRVLNQESVIDGTILDVEIPTAHEAHFVKFQVQASE
ncbi:MAG: GTPase HflX, partial [Anaerolineae bacterium]|nr:GTPase HflX [Anaerolineae bacterium]